MIQKLTKYIFLSELKGIYILYSDWCVIAAYSLSDCNHIVICCSFRDMEPVIRHPDFRLFACMNPATDVGKKDLSPGIRNRLVLLSFSLTCN